MKIADRIQNLGTETAFLVSAEAADYRARGQRIYPFHLGDMNIITPANIIEATHQAMRDGKTGYCSNYGLAERRELRAADMNGPRGTGYTIDNVVIQPGGKPSIGKLLMALMNPGDEVLYPNPGYPIYESQIEYHDGVAVPYGYVEGERNFEIDLERIEVAITPKTRILIVNDLHNPSGAVATRQELQQLAELACERDLLVLSDEAYFDIRYGGEPQSIVSFPGMEERSLILYTFSKKFAMTGWRLGAAIGPQEVVDVMAKLNVNDESCSNHFIQFGAIEALTGDQSGHQAIVATLRARRDEAVDRLNEIDGVNCYRPEATFYLFPNVTGAMQRRGTNDYEQFRKSVLDETGVAFCTRLHFGRAVAGETQRYIRLAYSGIDQEEISEGLGALKEFLKS